MRAEPPDDGRGDDELRDLWQTQSVEERKMSLEEIRTKAMMFEKKVRLRNLVEYSAAVVVVVGFGRQIFDPEPSNFMTRIGSALTVLATVYVVFTLHRKGAAKNVPDAMARASSVDFHRASLESQRDLLRDVWRWYLLPFVPGLIAIFVSFGIRDGLWLSPEPAADPLRAGAGLLLFAAFLIAFLVAVAAWNKRIMKRLQGEIDALSRQ
jgi:hypothetical protein